MSFNDQYSPARIADRMQIQDVMYKWCRAIDRLDSDGMRAVFHPGATDDHGPYQGDVEGLVAWVRERHKPIPFSSHQISEVERGASHVALLHKGKLILAEPLDELKSRTFLLSVTFTSRDHPATPPEGLFSLSAMAAT